MNRRGPIWRARHHSFDCGSRTHVMGILNVTPDSFSDGGLFLSTEAAVARGAAMAAAGADIIDVGGESTRPGSDPVPADEELGRVLPVIERLGREVDVLLSIDTRKPEVASRALESGASIVNDVSAGSDPSMFDVVRASSAGMVLMHMRGDPKTMQQHTDYDDVVGEVRVYLETRVGAAVASGIDSEYLAIDPGLGFAKTGEQSLLLMNRIEELLGLDRPVLVGPSRKSFIGEALGTQVGERLEGTMAAVAWVVGRGAHVVRAHDVKETVRVARMVDTIRRAAGTAAA